MPGKGDLQHSVACSFIVVGEFLIKMNYKVWFKLLWSDCFLRCKTRVGVAVSFKCKSSGPCHGSRFFRAGRFWITVSGCGELLNREQASRATLTELMRSVERERRSLCESPKHSPHPPPPPAQYKSSKRGVCWPPYHSQSRFSKARVSFGPGCKWLPLETPSGRSRWWKPLPSSRERSVKDEFYKPWRLQLKPSIKDYVLQTS